MRRGPRLFLAVLAFLTLPTLGAQAQQYYYPYGQGYNGGGFGGWGGSTAYGDIARGMGAYAAEVGTYNYENAQANAINANTIMGVNEYLYRSQQEANMQEAQLLARRFSRIQKSEMNAQKLADRVRDNPTEADIESGAALNAILHQLTEPRLLNGSTLRMANASVDARLIREIPFRNATDAVTITLGQLTDEKSWPFVLRDPRFDAPRTAYMKAVADALEEDKQGDLSPASVAKVRKAVADLYERVGETIPKTKQPDHLTAMNYLKGLAGFSRMLEQSNYDSVLRELEKIETTPVGNLLAFMHTYNLQFGPSTTPKQAQTYRALYPLLASSREKILGANPPPKTPAPSKPSTDLFNNMDPRALHAPTRTPPAPPTPAPTVTAPPNRP